MDASPTVRHVAADTAWAIALFAGRRRVAELASRMCYMRRVTQPVPALAPVQDAGSDAISAAAIYNADGVDLSLVRSMLARTPTERLQAVKDVIDLLASAKRARRR